MSKGDIQRLVQPQLKDLRPYEPHLYDNVIHLEANENPYPFPQEVMEKIFREMAQLGFNRYPDPALKDLREAIGQYAGVSKEQVLAGNGSDELIQGLLLTFAGPKAKVIIPSPTFSMYKIWATVVGASPVEVPLKADYNLDLPVLLKELEDPAATVVFLCSPNNPTGNLIPLEEVEEICQRSQGIVVLDEAYYEFARESGISILDKYPNLVILRTFSKAYALAGLRVGYILASEAIIKELFKVKLPFNLNSFSQVAARQVMENQPVFEAQIEEILANRDELWMELQTIENIKVFPSSANYFLIQVPEAPRVHKELIEEGILVRYLGGGPGLENCLRITVGTKEENSFLIEKLKAICNSLVVKR